MQVTTAEFVATKPAGTIHSHIVTQFLNVHPQSHTRHLDNGKLGSGDIESIDIGGQAGKGLLGSIRSVILN